MEGVDEELAHDRRSFLGKLGKTLAIGLGFGLLTSASASGTTNSCAIWCEAHCGGPECGTCGSGEYCYFCRTQCGYDFWSCLSHSPCGSFCFSPNAC